MDMPRDRARKFTIGRLVAVSILVGTILVFGPSWISLFVLAAVVAWICGDVLVSRLPLKFRREQDANCIRLDGSWSKRRERLESNALARMKRDVGVALMLVFVPNTMLACVIDRELLPISAGLGWFLGGINQSATSEIDFATGEREFDRWQEANSNPISNDERRQFLQTQWPLFLFAIFLWLAVGLYVLKRMYIQQLNQFEIAIRSRRHLYHLNDQARLFGPGKL